MAYSIEAILRFFSKILYTKYSIRVNYAVQKELMNETFKLNTKCYDENGTGVFIDRLYGDTYAIVSVYERLSNELIDILTNIGVVIVVFQKIFDKLTHSALIITNKYFQVFHLCHSS